MADRSHRTSAPASCAIRVISARVGQPARPVGDVAEQHQRGLLARRASATWPGSTPVAGSVSIQRRSAHVRRRCPPARTGRWGSCRCRRRLVRRPGAGVDGGAGRACRASRWSSRRRPPGRAPRPARPRRAGRRVGGHVAASLGPAPDEPAAPLLADEARHPLAVARSGRPSELPSRYTSGESAPTKRERYDAGGSAASRAPPLVRKWWDLSRGHSYRRSPSGDGGLATDEPLGQDTHEALGHPQDGGDPTQVAGHVGDPGRRSCPAPKRARGSTTASAGPTTSAAAGGRLTQPGQVQPSRPRTPCSTGAAVAEDPRRDQGHHQDVRPHPRPPRPARRARRTARDPTRARRGRPRRHRPVRTRAAGARPPGRGSPVPTAG